MCMNDIQIIITVVGTAMLATGLKMRRYKIEKFAVRRMRFKLDTIADNRYIKPLISFFIKNKTGILYRFSNWILRKSEAKIDKRLLYLLKCVSVILTTALLAGVKYTNYKIIRICRVGMADISIVLVSFWIPEIYFMLKRLLMNSRCKGEIMKLESLFELLGGMGSIKTVDILKEMSKVSKVYKGHLQECYEKYLIDKEIALENLRNSVKVARFRKLVDFLRIYALIDKTAAVEMLEKNRIQRDEEMLLTADEDVDMMDIIAFVSIIPIVIQITELLLKPMMNTVINAFSFM